jgi:hypothetical protein
VNFKFGLSDAMIESMFRSKRLNVLAAFVATAALLLNAAMPMLATAAAAIQGVAVADVCEVYGVSLPAQGPHAGHAMHMAHASGHGMSMGAAADNAAHHEHGSSGPHKAGHCALTGLAGLAPPGAVATTPVPVRADFLVDLLPSHGVVFDATARWAARMEHAPPLT